MAHPEQQQYLTYVRDYYPEFFSNKKVLDCGSLDVNGNNRYLFENCEYYGLDVGPGPNVDIVSPIHTYDAPDNSWDTIVSTECFEHDMFYGLSFKNILRMLKPGGLFIFTCATTGRGEHGTINAHAYGSPLTSADAKSAWASYYKNLTEKDIRKEIDIDNNFYLYEFSVHSSHRDLQFWGIKDYQ